VAYFIDRHGLALDDIAGIALPSAMAPSTSPLGLWGGSHHTNRTSVVGSCAFGGTILPPVT